MTAPMTRGGGPSAAVFISCGPAPLGRVDWTRAEDTLPGWANQSLFSWGLGIGTQRQPVSICELLIVP